MDKMYWKGVVVYGWSGNMTGLEFCLVINTEEEFLEAMREAWATPHVKQVTSQFLVNPLEASDG